MDTNFQGNEQFQNGTKSHSSSFGDEISNSSIERLLGNIQDEGPISKHYGSTEENSSLLSSSEQQIEKPVKRSVTIYSFVLINLVIILMSASNCFHKPLMDQYLYQWFSDSLLGNASVKTPRHPCIHDPKANGTSDIVDKVQDKTSQLLLYLDLTNYGLGIIGCLYLGLFSTVISRKLQLLIPVVGYLTKCMTITVVVCWQLNIKWFYLGYVVEGICGNMSGVFLGVFLYTIDITSRDKKRTFAIAIVEGSRGVVSAALDVVTGHLLSNSGFVLPAILSSVCVGVSVIVVLLLPNQKPKLQTSNAEGNSSCSRWGKTTISPFSKSYNARVRTMIYTGCAAFFLTEIAMSGVSKIRNLYLMNQPFCWTSITIGWFLFGREISHNICTMLSIPLLYRFFPGMGLAIFAVVSSTAGYIMYALANTDIELFTVPVLGIAHSVPIGLIRGETSRLFGPETQGPLFACMAVLESISYALGTPALLLYMKSLDFFKGLAFLVFAGFMVIVFVLLVIYQVVWKRYMREFTNLQKVF